MLPTDCPLLSWKEVDPMAENKAWQVNYTLEMMRGTVARIDQLLGGYLSGRDYTNLVQVRGLLQATAARLEDIMPILDPAHDNCLGDVALANASSTLAYTEDKVLAARMALEAAEMADPPDPERVERARAYYAVLRDLRGSRKHELDRLRQAARARERLAGGRHG
jgi:hypothetical protein